MRQATPLYPDEPSVAAPDSCFVTLLEGGFRTEGDEPQDWRTLTACLDFAGAAEQHTALRQVGGGIRNSRVVERAFSGTRAAADIVDFLLSSQSDQLGVLVVLPVARDGPGLAATVLAKLRAAYDQFPGIIIAASEAPSVWADLPGVDGHVRCDAKTLGAQAKAVFDVLSVCAAPALLGCVDLFDIQAGFDAADGPLEVVQSIWLQEEGELCFLREEDRARIASAQALVLAPLWSEARVKDVVKLRGEVLKHARADSQFISAMSRGHFTKRAAAAGAYPVVLLCGD